MSRSKLVEHMDAAEGIKSVKKKRKQKCFAKKAAAKPSADGSEEIASPPPVWASDDTSADEDSASAAHGQVASERTTEEQDDGTDDSPVAQASISKPFILVPSVMLAAMSDSPVQAYEIFQTEEYCPIMEYCPIIAGMSMFGGHVNNYCDTRGLSDRCDLNVARRTLDRQKTTVENMSAQNRSMVTVHNHLSLQAAVIENLLFPYERSQFIGLAAIGAYIALDKDNDSHLLSADSIGNGDTRSLHHCAFALYEKQLFCQKMVAACFIPEQLVSKWSGLINVQIVSLSEYVEIWKTTDKYLFSSNVDSKSWVSTEDVRAYDKDNNLCFIGYHDAGISYPEKFDNWGTFRYISEMTASFPTPRFEAIPTSRILHPDSGVDERMEEDDDIQVDSSQGVGAAPEEAIDERRQPEQDLKEPSHPDQEFHNAVKAKAMDAFNMLATGSIEVGERTGPFVSFGSDQHSVRNCDTGSPSLRQGLAWFTIMEEDYVL
ncbi:hypothetical protein AK812_SmicGene15325 [Symbiodinium microadriaticum]|uniref:Uncharacterized protein n=1 Tax=Symbiodinium microadriaticum TaxID=2951 RepID=A0A1Q9E376_SYMMI|nr:hypothetical protein AK812_SmicGene15325 [Symbiodinium microadriaticum]